MRVFLISAIAGLMLTGCGVATPLFGERAASLQAQKGLDSSVPVLDKTKIQLSLQQLAESGSYYLSVKGQPGAVSGARKLQVVVAHSARDERAFNWPVSSKGSFELGPLELAKGDRLELYAYRHAKGKLLPSKPYVFRL